MANIKTSPPPAHIPAEAVKAVRRFNRFYTRRIGVLDPYLGSDLSLTDMRVLYELAHGNGMLTATALVRALGLDAGYLSRILKRFKNRGWLARTPAPHDARQGLLALTPQGHEYFAPLQQRSRDETAALLAPLAPAQRDDLVAALNMVEHLLGGTETASPTRASMTVLRNPQPGDMGWVVQQHAEIYAREYGWNSEFEALVADIVAKYLRNFQPAWEKGWIAEIGGERVGAVFVTRKSATVAQLRMLLLTPAARGLGLGAQLCDICIAFARERGYHKLVLWTHSCLAAARGIYGRRGFHLVKSEPYHGYGHALVAETWELRL
ncbi:MAG TPA: bifunctional helix-turn-helix transcriptional regulator/GNAT family N-acetyltransferase [Burkholderiaceae bacterium]